MQRSCSWHAPSRVWPLVPFVLAACGGGGEEELATAREGITNAGQDDADTSVVAVLGKYERCTGTLLSPRVVLTAAHCVPELGASELEVHFGANLASVDTRRVIDARRDPTFEAATLANDLGLLLLDRAAPPAAQVASLPRAAMDASWAGRTVRVVGFGLASATDPGAGPKRSGLARIAAVGAADFTLHGAPSQTCSGDSGGPAFASVDGADVLVGVTSGGDEACASYGREARVDVRAEAFIGPYLAATAPAAAALGARCWDDGGCAEGRCAAPPDAPSIRYCARACDDGASCPSGTRCTGAAEGARVCLRPPPSPGALGVACAAPYDCASGVCLSSSADAPAVCTMHCAADPAICAPGFRCAPLAGAAADAVCVADPAPSSSRGCRVGSGTDTGRGEALIALAAISLAARRRRRNVR